MFDSVLAFGKIITSALGAEAKHLLVQVRAFAVGEDDETAETSNDEPMYGALGVVSRPRDRDDKGVAEVVAARGESTVTPIAARDLRISKARGNVKKGSTGIAGYGGSFLSLDDAPSGTGSIVTIYAPYEHDDGGVPAKAHAFIIDTTSGNESIVLAHAEGHAILLTKDKKLVIKNADGSVFVSLEDGGVTCSGSFKATSGIIVGGASAAKSLLIDPSESGAWHIQVTAAITAIAGLLNVAGSVSGAPGTVPPIVAPLPIPSTIAKAAPTP